MICIDTNQTGVDHLIGRRKSGASERCQDGPCEVYAEFDTESSQNGIRPSRAPIERLKRQAKVQTHTLSSPATTTTTIGIVGSTETASDPEMLLPRRHPRFSLLLASFILTALLLLLPHSPLAAFQPSAGSSSRPVKPPVVYQGVAARVRRAERAYQKMLRGRDALIAKVGPTPRDVALSVSSFVSSSGRNILTAVQISTRQGAVATIYSL